MSSDSKLHDKNNTQKDFPGFDETQNVPTSKLHRMIAMIRELLIGGLSKQKVAEMVFWSVWIGLLPVPMTHSIGIAAIAILRGFNVPASIALAASVLPLELALVVPDYWVGSLVVGESVAFDYFIPTSVAQFWDTMAGVASRVIIGWAILGFVVASIFYGGIRFAFNWNETT